MASRWLTMLSVLAAVLLLGSAGWHVWELRRVNEQMLVRRLHSIDRVFMPSLAKAARDENMAAVHELLARLTRDPAILNATLRDINGKARDFSGQTPPPPPNRLPSKLETGTYMGVQRWIQPLEIFASQRPLRRFWLDLMLDPRRAAETTRTWLITPALWLAILITVALAAIWHKRWRDGNTAVGNASSRAPEPRQDSELSYVSHELRAPLSGLLGFCRLLENSPLDAQQREWLRHIHLASNGLLDTIDHVLGDTRRDRISHVFDIAELLWDVLSLQAPLAQSKHMTLLAIVYDDVPPRLVGPDTVVRQLLTNLINNAIKYGKQGDIIVRVVLEKRDDNDARLRLSVSDNGSSDPADRIRLRQAIENDPGLDNAEIGMGIAICHRLAAELNGSLTLGPRPGKGVTVMANVVLQAREPFIRPAEFDLGKARIALWQPHTQLAHLLKHALERWNAQCQHLVDADSLIYPEVDTSLTIVGISHDDLTADAQCIWQKRFDAMDKPCLLLVNAGPEQSLDWRLPEGSAVLRLPVSRYILGRTLARMLSENRHRKQHRQPLILVVDDDEISRHYLEALLSAIDATAITVGNAEEALVVASERKVDLVLMDLHFPGTHGFEILERLRGLNQAWRTIPIIAMTADSDTRRHRLLSDSGIEELLVKPLDERCLREALSRHFPGLGPGGNNTSLPTTTTQTSVDAERRPSSQRPRVNDLPIVDKALALRLSSGREALVEEMRSLLLAELPGYRRQLHAAWLQQDSAGFQEIVHQLGGGCRYCGVPQLSAACETLEAACRNRGLYDCDEAYRALLAACDYLLVWAEDQRITNTQ